MQSVGRIAEFPAGESPNREFKGWLRLPRAGTSALEDQRTGSSHKIRQGIFDLIRTVAALHNADSGDLFIGMNNTGAFLGDMRDLSAKKERNDAEKVINTILVHHLIPKIHVHPDVIPDSTGTKFALRFRVDAGPSLKADSR